MSFITALKAETAKSAGGRSCSVARILATSSDAADIRVALATDVDSSTIARALIASGVIVSATTVRRHRRGDCPCGRDA